MVESPAGDSLSSTKSGAVGKKNRQSLEFWFTGSTYQLSSEMSDGLLGTEWILCSLIFKGPKKTYA